MSIFNLTFLAPLALAGLAAIAVPIYLHLRHKPRSEVLKFAAIDFLLRAQKKRKRRFKAEQWLLMLARIAIIAAMAALFARPMMEERFQSFQVDGDQPLVLILDDSLSMMADAGQGRFFNLAIEEIDGLLDGRRGGAPTWLLPASNPEKFRDYRTAAALQPFISSLKAQTISNSLDAAYSRALRILEEEGFTTAVVQIYTDGSISAWNQLPDRKPSGVDVRYRTMRDPRAPFENMGITAVQQPPDSGSSHLEVTLRNSAGQAGRVPLRLDTGKSRLTHDMGIQAGEFASHLFVLDDELPERVSLTLPDDHFDLDNRVVFAPKRNKILKVLVVDGDSHPDAARSEAYFLKNALGMFDQDGSFELEIITPSGLTPAKVAPYDVLMLLNVDSPDQESVAQAWRDGKGVFASMGSRVIHADWRELLQDSGVEVWEPKMLDSPQSINVKTHDHPLFAGFVDNEWDTYFQEVGVAGLNLISVGRSGAKVPLALFDGTPLLVTKDLNPGRLVLWSSSFDIDWTNFPLQFGYLPFVRELVRYLAGEEESGRHRIMTVGQLQDDGIANQVSLKEAWPGYEDLPLEGPLPGIYIHQAQRTSEHLQVMLDPRELDFTNLEQAAGASGPAPGDKLEELGFRSTTRSDLGPGIQWLLFALILVETLAAARITLNWGSR